MNAISKKVILAGSGLLMGLVVSYFVPAFLQWVAMVPFCALLFSYIEKDSDGHLGNRKRIVKHFWLGFLYFYPYYLTVWYWFLTMYPLDFTGLSKAAALGAVLAAWLGLPFLQAFCASLQVPLFAFAVKSRFIEGKKYGKLLTPVLFAALYVVFEWTQILTWAGVPWGRLAIGQGYAPIFLQTAALFGPYFVTLVIVLVNAYIAEAIVAYKDKIKVIPLLSVLMAVLTFALNLTLCGAVSLLREDDSDAELFSVGVIQGNVSSTDKWRDGSFDGIASVYGRLTKKAADDGADLILWSETSFPYILNEYSYRRRFVESTANANGVTLLATSFWREPDGIMYNSVMTVTPGAGIDEDNIYHKQRLVPFGEFVPYENIIKVLFPPLAGLSMFGNSVGSGGGASVQMTDMGPIGTLVCFDSIYEEYAMEAVRDGAELLTISTNDSWFGTSAALYQHTAQGVLRAIETDRYVVRSANTGFSCAISPDGKIIEEFPVGEEGCFIADVYGRSTVTLYSVIGDIFVVFSAVFAAVMLFDGIIYNKIKRKEK